jgi:ABC-2 type transport system ATP-binding protein
VCQTIVIETNEVSKHFGEIIALRNISIKVYQGEFFGLFGPNGAGKTTLLRILTGQITPDTGSVLTAGISSDDPISIKKAIGIVPEAETPPSFLTAQEVLELTCRIRRIENSRARIEKWLDFFEMMDNRHVLCRDLSKGQRQKLMLASAFIHEPQLLLLDEPFINLDPIFQRKVRDYLTSLIEEGRTIFMCTHILEIAEKLCTRIAVINDGQIVEEGTLDQMRATKGENLEDIFIRLVVEGTELTT